MYFTLLIYLAVELSLRKISYVVYVHALICTR